MDATRHVSLALHRNDDVLTTHILKFSLVLNKMKKFPTNGMMICSQMWMGADAGTLSEEGIFSILAYTSCFVSDPRTRVCITD